MSDKNDDTPSPGYPDPNEISRKLSDFLKSNFGDGVSFSTMPGGANPFASDGAPDPTGEDHDLQDDRADIFDFDLLPRQIKQHLDRFVIKQDAGVALPPCSGILLCVRFALDSNA